MLTDYLVRCPHANCSWHGCLFPKGNRDAWKPAVPTAREVTFECPRCRGQWRARLVGDDAIVLPATLQPPEELVAPKA